MATWQARSEPCCKNIIKTFSQFESLKKISYLINALTILHLEIDNKIQKLTYSININVLQLGAGSTNGNKTIFDGLMVFPQKAFIYWCFKNPSQKWVRHPLYTFDRPFGCRTQDIYTPIIVILQLYDILNNFLMIHEKKEVQNLHVSKKAVPLHSLSN